MRGAITSVAAVHRNDGCLLIGLSSGDTTSAGSRFMGATFGFSEDCEAEISPRLY